MSNKDQYIITDLDAFTLSARKLIYNGFGKGMVENQDEFTKLITDISQEALEELNQILSQKEAVIIVKQLIIEQKHKTKNKIRYLLNDKIFEEIIEALNSRFVSNMLSNLASKGLIESAYDPEINDFIFWSVDNKEQNEENQPETN